MLLNIYSVRLFCMSGRRVHFIVVFVLSNSRDMDFRNLFYSDSCERRVRPQMRIILYFISIQRNLNMPVFLCEPQDQPILMDENYGRERERTAEKMRRNAAIGCGFLFFRSISIKTEIHNHKMAKCQIVAPNQRKMTLLLWV